MKPIAILRRQIFVIKIVGLYLDETPTIVHVESTTTVKDVIQNALSNAGKLNDSPEEYDLFEESVASNCSPSPIHDHNPGTSFSLDSFSTDNIPTKRILPLNEHILDSVMCWNGVSRRFYLRKRANESGRGWITNIINKGGISNSTSPVFGQNRKPVTTIDTTTSSANTMLESNRGSPFHGLGTHGSQKGIKSHSSNQIHGRSLDVDQPVVDYLDPTLGGLHPRARSMGETFLVCVYVTKEQYVFLRSSLYNNARDVLKQVSF